jgi:hypothetical protein
MSQSVELPENVRYASPELETRLQQGANLVVKRIERTEDGIAVTGRLVDKTSLWADLRPVAFVGGANVVIIFLLLGCGLASKWAIAGPAAGWANFAVGWVGARWHFRATNRLL